MHDHHDFPVDFSTLLLRLYRLSQELPISLFQDAALAQIKYVLPFDSAMWGTATAAPNGIDIHTVHLHQKSPEMLAEYEPVKHLDSAAASMFGKSHVTGVFHSESWFADAENREMRAFLHKFQQQNALIAADSNPFTHFVHWVSLYRADKHAHGTKSERQLLSQLAPHVMQALALNRVMHLGQLGPSDKAMSPHGNAIADARGMLYHADSVYVNLVKVEWSELPNPHLPKVLLDYFLSPGHHCFVGRTVVVRCYFEHGLLFLKARSRCLADQLNQREWAIAKLIAQGSSYKEIAQAFNRSPATVRNQIHAIYEKLQINSIAMLIDALRKAE